MSRQYNIKATSHPRRSLDIDHKKPIPPRSRAWLTCHISHTQAERPTQVEIDESPHASYPTIRFGRLSPGRTIWLFIHPLLRHSPSILFDNAGAAEDTLFVICGCSFIQLTRFNVLKRLREGLPELCVTQGMHCYLFPPFIRRLISCRNYGSYWRTTMGFAAALLEKYILVSSKHIISPRPV